ncbi:MAG: hypothetical protein AAF639_33060 [Chloroflexota bacterium]
MKKVKFELTLTEKGSARKFNVKELRIKPAEEWRKVRQEKMDELGKPMRDFYQSLKEESEELRESDDENAANLQTVALEVATLDAEALITQAMDAMPEIRVDLIAAYDPDQFEEHRETMLAWSYPSELEKAVEALESMSYPLAQRTQN